MGKVMEEGAKRAVDVRVLAALPAIGASERSAAVEAGRFVRVSFGFARLWFDRAADDAAGDRISYGFELAHATPLCRYIMRAWRLMLAGAHGAHRPSRRLVQSGPPRAP